MSKPEKTAGGIGKIILRILICAVIVVAAAAAGIVLFATVTEYRPEEVEALDVMPVHADQAGTAENAIQSDDTENKNQSDDVESENQSGDIDESVQLSGAANEEDRLSGKTLQSGDTVRAVLWNIGYGALGDNADFFMDGGSRVYTADAARVQQNLQGIADELSELQPDILLLQETDRDSSRSRHVDEANVILDALPEMTDWTFAWNFKVPFVPYPIPPIGKVSSGLMTLSAFPIEAAQRVQLPCPFSWPVRTVNLKRCAAIHRIPLEGGGKELVVVNLHLEAYDSGEGKAAQTKMLRDLLQKERDAGNYVIAGGDFNQVFSNTDVSAYPVYGNWQPGIIDVGEFSDGWQLVMDSSHPTCRSLDRPLEGADREKFQFYVIDGFIFSDNVEVLSVQTQDQGFVCSDHNPVMAEVRLK